MELLEKLSIQLHEEPEQLIDSNPNEPQATLLNRTPPASEPAAARLQFRPPIPQSL